MKPVVPAFRVKDYGAMASSGARLPACCRGKEERSKGDPGELQSGGKTARTAVRLCARARKMDGWPMTPKQSDCSESVPQQLSREEFL